MDKKSVTAIIIMTVLILGIFIITGPLMQKSAPSASPAATASPAAASPLPSPSPALAPSPSAAAALAPAKKGPEAGDSEASLNAGIPAEEQQVVLENDVVKATFSSKGGQLESYLLKKHLMKDAKGGPREPVEMILKSDGGSYAFAHAVGDPYNKADSSLMAVSRPDPLSVEFSRVYTAPGADGVSVPYTLKKRFSFKPDEYMFEVSMTVVNSINAAPSLNKGGFAYTLFYGPQIGPEFTALSTYGELRNYQYMADGKRKNVGVARTKGVKSLKERAVWSAIVGKYFSLAAIPDATQYTITYNTNPMPGIPFVSQLSLSRPPITASTNTDTFRFYLGPNKPAELQRYDTQSKNGFGYSALKLESISPASGWFSFPWLANFLQIIMSFFFRLIPNWGVSIVILTLLVKGILFPLTFKSSIGMAKMQDMQPKMAEIQAKYKDKPEKLQQAMMEFYKKEGYNPLSGCLPMLIQIPIFFAMYTLFSTNFDLRGASFIPGWIPDLSLPDSVLNFPTVNLVIWHFDALRILPIVYVVSQLLYGKYTQMSQPSPGQSKTQMNIMLYGMPIFFFFVLYDAPSGLLVYWIVQNVLTIVQQIVTNRIIHNRKMRQRSS